MSTTATTYGARDHARAQAGTVVETMPSIPASTWAAPPPGVAAEALTWAETVAGGGYTHKVLARGTRLRLTDVEGDACAHVLLFNADGPWERLNVADTVKVQWNAYLGEKVALLSDQARVLATIVADSSGRHDALCGTSTVDGNTERYGDGAPQGPSPPACRCSPWPRRRTGSARVICRPACRSSRACGSSRKAPWSSPAPRAPGSRSTCGSKSRRSC